jgi:hypothetical protein
MTSNVTRFTEGQPRSIELRINLEAQLIFALDRFIAEMGADISRPTALRIAFQDWAVAHGYLRPGDEGIRPEDLNASNDD